MKNESRDSHRVRNLFFITVAAVFISFDFFLALFVINWSSAVSIAMYVIITVLIYSFSLQLTNKVFSIFLKPYSLYKLNCALTTNPKVAILYSTMNDVLPECLSIIDQTYPCDVFVLDDSSLAGKRKIVDEIASEKGFTILRRKERKGFKAGAINNWISLHGKEYDYFILLDSDSYIPEDWVEKALMYAENPLNSKVAIFQGLINIWNLDNKFIRTLSALHKVGQDIWELRLANYLDAVFCYGHNVMIRTKPVLEIGGFVEGYVSEDFATAVKLAERGYKSRFVPLHTYEAMPENIRGFIKRQHKWTRGSIEFLSFIKNYSLSLTQKVLLFSIPLGHFSYIGILGAMFLTIFGYATTSDHFASFLLNLIYHNIFFIWSIPIFRFAIILQALSLAVTSIKFRQLGISFGQSFKHDILSKAVGTIMLPYEIKSLVSCAIDRRLKWPVTPKHESRLNFREILSISKITLVLSLVFILGLLLVNPLGFIFNVSWLIPFLFAPVILYFYSNDKINSGTLYSDGGNYDNGIQSGESQPKEVHSFLRKTGSADSKHGLSMTWKKIIFASLIVLLFFLSGLFVYDTITAFFIYQPQKPTNMHVCGNGICEIGENSTTCPQDCPSSNVTPQPSVKGGLKLVAPTVTGPNQDPNEINVNDIVKLSVYVEKLGDANVSRVWSIAKSPNGNLATVQLSENGVWGGSVEVKEDGFYLATFNAVDESNTYADQVTIAFYVSTNTSIVSNVLSFGSVGSAGIPAGPY